MIIRVKLKKNYTSRRFAALWVTGGLAYSRGKKKAYSSEYGTAEYGREIQPLRFPNQLRSLNRSRKRYFRKVKTAARRILKLYDSPTLTSSDRLTEVKLSFFQRMVNYGLTLLLKVNASLPFPLSSLFALVDTLKNKYSLTQLQESVLSGYRFLTWTVRKRDKFARWRESANRLPVRSLWPVTYRYSKQSDPLRKSYFFRLKKTTVSLTQFRFEKERTTAQLRGLLRRKRNLLRVRRAYEELETQYLQYYYGKTRRKLGKPPKRHHQIRRRRLRSYRVDRITAQNYFLKTTKLSFFRNKVNRLYWLEQAQLLTNKLPYYQAIGQWFNVTLGSRIGSPIEYNYLKSFDGYNRIVKKRNERARRWKLLQHPTWSYLFKILQLQKVTWLQQTKLYQLTVQQTVDPAAANPIRPSLQSACYWSLQPWGRSSRWRTRPTGRARTVFLQSINSGLSYEHDYDSWGFTAVHRLTTLLSLTTQFDLRLAQSTPRTNSRGRFFFRSITSFQTAQKSGKRFFHFLFRLVWFGVVTPVWWVYRMVSQAWVLFFFPFLFPFAYLKKLTLTVNLFLYHFLIVQLFRPFKSAAWGWAKEREITRTLGWVYTSWVMAYSSEDDKLVTTVHNEDHEQNDVLHDENFDVQHEHLVDFDQLNEEAYQHWGLTAEHQIPWQHEIDSFWDDFWEGVELLFYEEIPYAVRLVFHPAINLIVRLPYWGLLEGVTLLGLTFKTEFQQRYLRFLVSPTVPRVIKWVVALFSFGLSFLPFFFLYGVLLQTVDLVSIGLYLEQTFEWPIEEEITLGTYLLLAVLTVKLVGPSSWKKYLFDELGLSNLFLLFTGVVTLLDPEPYYPSRASGPLTKLETRIARGVGIFPRYPETTYTNRPTELYQIQAERLSLRASDRYDRSDHQVILYDAYEDQIGYVFSAHDNVDETDLVYRQLAQLEFKPGSPRAAGLLNRQSEVYGSYDSQLNYNNKYELIYRPMIFTNTLPPIHNLPYTNYDENDNSAEG